MNLEHFELLKEDENDMHVKHPSGKVLVVSKAAMSDKAKGLVKKMACGGMVKGYESGGWVEGFEKSAAEIGKKVNNAFGGNQVKQAGSDKKADDYEAKNESDLNRQIMQGARKNPNTYTGTQDMPNYAKGGEVAEATEVTPDKGYGKIIRVGLNEGGGIPQNLLAPAPVDQGYDGALESLNFSMPQAAPQAAAPVEQVAQPVMQAEQPDVYDKQINDVRELERAQSGLSQEAAGAYKNYSEGMSKLSSPQEMMDEMNSKDEVLKQEYMKGNLDPNRMWHSMSTGSKVLAGISLALGGIGAGLTGGKNSAEEWLSKAIDNDIEAQKNDQSKKMTLWRMNREAYGDDIKATIATQNQLQTGLQAALAATAAKAASPEAKFRAESMINDIEQKKMANRQKMSLLSGAASGNLSGTDPLLLASDPNIVPEGSRQKVTDEIGKAEYVAKNEQQMLELFDKAEHENTIRGSFGRAFHDAPSTNALRLLAVPLLRDEAGRVNEHAVKSFESILPEVFEKKATGESNRAAMIKFINTHKQAPTARSFGINVENYKTTSTDPVKKLDGKTKSYYDFAKAHPELPVSQDFFAKHPELKGE